MYEDTRETICRGEDQVVNWTTNGSVSYPVLVLQQFAEQVVHVQNAALAVLHVVGPHHVLHMLHLWQARHRRLALELA